jgi:sirohydrochlorin ferrochelatase
VHLTKLYIPEGDDVAERVVPLLASGGVHVMVDPHEIAAANSPASQSKWFVDMTNTAVCVDADLIVVDDWSNCTRAEQASVLEVVGALCRGDKVVILRYTDWAAFRHDGALHNLFGVKA